jgi:FG-GAP-like repeat
MAYLRPLAVLALVLLVGGVLTPRAFQPDRAIVSRIALPTGFHPQAIASADLDGDGYGDAVLCGADGAVLLLVNNGRGTLEPVPSDASCGAHPDGITTADLDADGRIDVVVANHETDYVTVLHNDGGLRFSACRVHVHSNPHPHTVAAADVDGDGRVDLLTDSWAERRLTLLRADGRGGWLSPGTPIETGRAPYVNIVAADFDGDLKVDLAFPNAAPTMATDTVTVLFGDGRGHFAPAPQSPLVAGPAPFMIAAGDIDGDGRPDLFVANYSGHMTDTSRDGLTWIRNDGNRRFTAFPDRIVTGNGTWMVASGDLNGDGFADAAFINAGDDTIRLVYGSAAGPRPGGTVTVMPQPHRLAFADLGHTGHASLLVITEGRDEVWVVSP